MAVKNASDLRKISKPKRKEKLNIDQAKLTALATAFLAKAEVEANLGEPSLLVTEQSDKETFYALNSSQGQAWLKSKGFTAEHGPNGVRVWWENRDVKQKEIEEINQPVEETSNTEPTTPPANQTPVTP